MSTEFPCPTEAVLEKALHPLLVLGEGEDAVADVAGREDVESHPEAAGAASVVHHRDDRRQVGGHLLQSTEECREPGPSAQGDDPRSLLQDPRPVDQVAWLLSPARGDAARDRADETREAERKPGHPGDCKAGQDGVACRPVPGEEPVQRDDPFLPDRLQKSEGEDARRGEDEDAPALDPHPGGEPAQGASESAVHGRAPHRKSTCPSPTRVSSSCLSSVEGVTRRP